MMGKFKTTVAELEERCIELAPAINNHLNDGTATVDDPRPIGFCLVAFEFGEPGTPLAFVSNAQPEDLRRALRELAERLTEVGRSHKVRVPRG